MARYHGEDQATVVADVLPLIERVEEVAHHLILAKLVNSHDSGTPVVRSKIGLSSESCIEQTCCKEPARDWESIAPSAHPCILCAGAHSSPAAAFLAVSARLASPRASVSGPCFAARARFTAAPISAIWL